MNIYEQCIGKVSQGANYSIDFKKRSLKVDGNVVIDNGIPGGELHFDKNEDVDDVLKIIEDMYSIYKHSIPSEKTDSKRRNYFYALKEEDLEDNDMMYGERRMESMFNLEYYILENIINGSLYWKDDWGWFWQSENDKDLIILREWIKGE